jgi:hypothetical protein
MQPQHPQPGWYRFASRNGRPGALKQSHRKCCDSPRHFRGEHAIAKRLCGISTQVYGDRPQARAGRELITDPLEGSPALIEAINLEFAFFGTNP